MILKYKSYLISKSKAIKLYFSVFKRFKIVIKDEQIE